MKRRYFGHIPILDLSSIVAMCLAFATAVAGAGVPALRHDWGWPRDRTAALWAWWSVSGPWTAVGIGGPNANPNHVFANALCVVLQMVFGTHVGLWIVTFSIAIYGACSARRLVLNGRRDTILGLSAAAFVLAAPWTYSEVVAGHLYTIAAGFAILAVVAEIRTSAPRAHVLVLSAAVALAQLQLFIAVAVLIASYSWLRRQWVPIVALLCIGSGPASSLFIHRSALAMTPFTVSWETGQSLLPAASLATTGYFAEYTVDWPYVSANATLLVAFGAMAGAIFGADKRAAIFAAIVTAIIIVFVSAPLGPLAATYDYLAEHFAIVAVFRELYTPVVLLYVTYLVGFGELASRYRVASWLMMVCTLALVFAWIAVPPSRQWVPARAIPVIKIPQSSGRRFALLPGIQPLSVRDRAGSGLDPDAYPRNPNKLPLNVPDLRYPEAEAFQRASYERNFKDLAKLGAGVVLARPYLRTEVMTLRPQGAEVKVDRRSLPPATFLYARPYAAMAPLPKISTVPGALDDDAILFTDLSGRYHNVPATSRNQPRGIPAVAPRRFVDPAKGWIDARLAYLTYPWTAQAFGGAFTVSKTARLQVAAGSKAALVKIDGLLVTDRGFPLGRGTSTRFMWIDIPPDTKTLACVGRCLIATFAERKPTPSLPMAPAVEIEARASIIVPWLILVEVTNSNHPRLLRLLSRSDGAWAGYLNGSEMVATRVDGVFAGWIVPQQMYGTAFLVDRAAFVVIPLELLALGFVLTVCMGAVKKARVTYGGENSSYAVSMR